jgi:hypothetical protein
VRIFQGIACKSARASILAVGFFAAIYFGNLSGTSRADMISGSAEFDATLSQTTTKDANGVVTANSKGNDFIHRYNVSLDLNPYPLLKIIGGSQFRQEINTVHDINLTNHSTETVINPFLDILLGNPLYQLGVGYIRNADTLSSLNGPTSTAINEEYHGLFSWKPMDFPDLSLRVSHSNRYDTPNSIVNTTVDQINAGSRYSYKGLNLQYQFNDTDTMDNLHNGENTLTTHNGMISYADQFFDNRVSLNSVYNFNYLGSTNKAGNGGSVDTPRFPFSGLSIYSNTPFLGAADQNPANPALIDGNLLVSAGINIGVPPPPVDTTKQWSMGVDFGFGTVQEINTILIFVDRQLPPGIYNSFSWNVYIRSNDTDNWTLWQSGLNAQFISSPPNSFNFRITINDVKTRFVKVAVTPLSESVALANPTFQNPGSINVTEFQGILNQPAAQAKTSSSKTSQLLNCDVKTRILNSPSLYHSMSFLLNSSAPGGSTNYILTNNLLLNHKINDIFTMGATAGREDASQGNGHTTAYLYTATLQAVPLSGLSNTLLYNGRTEFSHKGTSVNNSIFLNNIAQVYRGVSFNFSGGYSLATDETGITSSNVQLIGAANITPRQDLTFNISYNYNKSNQSGGTSPPSSTTNQIGSMGISYRPFPTLNLFVSYGMLANGTRKTEFTQNYGSNWSPFPDGNLQFNFSYSENFDTLDSTKNTTIAPSISWKITPRATMDVTYSILSSVSDLGSTESNIFSTILRFSF